MSHSLRIRMVQMACEDGAIEPNLASVLTHIQTNAGQCDLLLFPETCLQGFPNRANVGTLALEIDSSAITQIRDAARAAGLAVALGIAERLDRRYLNTALLIDELGEIRLRYHKTHLYKSDEGVFERGDVWPVCEWHGLTVGFLICFDIEFPETARALARQGAQLILVPDGNMDFSAAVHHRALPVRAMENQVFMVMCNRVGAGDQYTFCGESQAVNPFGDTLALGGSAEEQTLEVALDLSQAVVCKKDLDYLNLIHPTLQR